jgi:TonB family protein
MMPGFILDLDIFTSREWPGRANSPRWPTGMRQSVRRGGLRRAAAGGAMMRLLAAAAIPFAAAPSLAQSPTQNDPFRDVPAPLVRPRPVEPAPAAQPRPAPQPPASRVSAPLRAPSVAYNPAPDYPASSRLRGEQGRVSLLVQVDTTGQVTGVSVVGSSGFPTLDRTAEAAVRRWRFEPAMQDGRPVFGTATVDINFRLEGEAR